VTKALAAEVHEFLKVHFLHWVEAMSLIRRTDDTIENLIQLEVWLNEIGGVEAPVVKVRSNNQVETAMEKLAA
jgi:hypothetical protein